MKLGEEVPERPAGAPMHMPISGLSCNQHLKLFECFDSLKRQDAEAAFGVHKLVPEDVQGVRRGEAWRGGAGAARVRADAHAHLWPLMRLAPGEVRVH